MGDIGSNNPPESATAPSDSMASKPLRKKRKLPSLDASFDAPSRPVDLPYLHQGRKRTVPHEKGQWASHVYLELQPSSAFRKMLKAAVEIASAPSTSSASTAPSPVIHSLLASTSEPYLASQAPSLTLVPRSASAAVLSEPSPEGTALHLSLSRPLILQTNQRADLRAAVAKVAANTTGFSARYASFGVLENDEKTRRFLGIEIGAGYGELHALVRNLDDKLTTLRLPTYYHSPRFHTSLAWTTSTTSTCTTSNDPLPFSPQGLATLEEQYSKPLRDEELWVGQLCVKIGKEVARYALTG
ncbi:hypothetical protein JCM11641_005598 [Rhodosporidiobolus odoratus]